MEDISCANQPTRASIRFTYTIIGGSVTIKVADEAEATLDSNLDDVYVAPVDDSVSTSGDEFDD